MNHLYLLRLMVLCWTIAGMATTDNLPANILQEFSFALMGYRLERARPGESIEAAFEMLDLLAA